MLVLAESIGSYYVDDTLQTDTASDSLCDNCDMIIVIKTIIQN